MPWPWVGRAELIAAVSRALEAERREAAKEAERALWERMYTAIAVQLQGALTALAESNQRATEQGAEGARRYEALTLQVVELKRAEAGLPPMAFDATLLDPMNSLGPKTQLAIDEFAAGDPEMKKYLVGRAHLEWSALAGQVDDVKEVDKRVAEMVRRGDR